MQMPLIFARRTVVVSGGGSVASDWRTPRRLAAPAAERPARKQRRLWMICMFKSRSGQMGSGFQFALKFVEEAEVSAFGDDFLWARLDDARLLHAQGVEAQRGCRIELSPHVIAYVLQRLHSDVVVGDKTSIDQLPGAPGRICHTKVGALEDSPNHAFGRHWVSTHVICSSRDHAAEVLRPRGVNGRIEDRVTEFLAA